MKRLLLHSFFLLLIYTVQAQQVWSLQQCLKMGISNSPQFQLSQLDILSAETTHRSPLMEYLPKVSITANHSYSIGSTIDPATNNRVSSNIQSDDFALNANMNLINFNIFSIARRNKIAVLKAEADREAIAAEYSLSVLENYFNVIYTQELLKIQLSQFENARFNLARIEKEVAIGSKPKSDLYDMQVSYAQEENNVLQTKQLLYNQKLALIQLLNVTTVAPNDIVLENTGTDSIEQNPDTNKKIEEAIINYPKIRAAQLAADIARKEITIQKNNYLPAVSAFYSYSSFYYLPLKSQAAPVNPFWTQLNDNKNHYIGLQLTVPVFNGLTTHRDVQLAKLEFEKRNVETEQEKIKLRQAIESEAAKQKQNAELAVKLEDTKVFAQKSFETTQAKFSSGLVEAIVFTTSKNQLLNAEYNLLKAQVTVQYTALKINYLQFNTFYP